MASHTREFSRGSQTEGHNDTSVVRLVKHGLKTPSMTFPKRATNATATLS